MYEPDTKTFVLELFNLEEDNVKDISLTNVNGEAHLDVFLADSPIPCPDCGYTHPRIKGYVRKNITHSVLSDRKCILNYHARRYRCPVCDRTYYEKNPFCFKDQKISVLTVQNVLKDLKKHNETFSSVAQRYFISPTSAASIFDSHVMMDRLTLPEYMSWDECYAFHHYGENSKYVCMFIDYKTAAPIDILPSRRYDYLMRYLLNIPKEERDKVKMISTDMFETYRSVIHSAFPKALLSVDHYHLSSDLNRRVDAVRIRIMKTQSKGSDNYYLLKHFNWLLFKSMDTTDKDGIELFDVNRKRMKNRKLDRYLNYYDIRILLENIHPHLKEAWSLKDDFVSFYDDNTVSTAESSLNALIESYRASEVPEIREFAKTLNKWKTEILNSFITVFTDYRVNKDTGHVELSERKLNNGLMENRNSILKIIKKNANGYTNWERFRNRCLYVLRKDAVYSLYPSERKKDNK